MRIYRQAQTPWDKEKHGNTKASMESGSHFVKCAKKKSEYGNANRRKTRDRVRIYNEPARAVRAAAATTATRAARCLCVYVSQPNCLSYAFVVCESNVCFPFVMYFMWQLLLLLLLVGCGGDGQWRCCSAGECNVGNEETDKHNNDQTSYKNDVTHIHTPYSDAFELPNICRQIQ